MLRLVARFGLGCEFGRRWWLVCWVLILVACVWVTFCGFAWCSSLSAGISVGWVWLDLRLCAAVDLGLGLWCLTGDFWGCLLN